MESSKLVQFPRGNEMRYRMWHKVVFASILFLFGVCCYHPGATLDFMLDDVPRHYFLAVTFPRTIKPAIETLPNVAVTKVQDGEYEHLIYVTLMIDSTWTIWLSTYSSGNLMEGGHFQIERVGRCEQGGKHFATLADAITF